MLRSQLSSLRLDFRLSASALSSWSGKKVYVVCQVSVLQLHWRHTKTPVRIMSPYRRNVLVGATVLLAMGILGWMILQFGGHVITPFTVAKTRVMFIGDRSDGLSDGSPVVYRGVNV